MGILRVAGLNWGPRQASRADETKGREAGATAEQKEL